MKCPKCGYEMIWEEFQFDSYLSRWVCPKCRSEEKMDYRLPRIEPVKEEKA